MADDFRMPFGTHRDEMITRVPLSYLRWMVGVRAQHWEKAEAELQRRGTTLPTLEVSLHAIDRASTRCWKVWHRTRESKEEGIASWLHRLAAEMVDGAATIPRGLPKILKANHPAGVRFVIDLRNVWPVVLTVYSCRPTCDAETDVYDGA